MPTQRQPEESAQLTLLAGADAQILAEDERKGQFTGERLKSCRPEAYREIVRAYAGGASMRSLARLYHVSINTVSAVVKLESSLIEALKKEIGAKATAVHSLAWERLEEKLADDEQVAKTTLKDMAVVVGITGDRAALADGLPTQIHRVERIEADDINSAFLAALPVEAEEVSDLPEMGFGGELPGQKGDGSGVVPGDSKAGSEGVEPAESGSDAGDRDSMSPVVDTQSVDNQGGFEDDA